MFRLYIYIYIYTYHINLYLSVLLSIYLPHNLSIYLRMYIHNGCTVEGRGALLALDQLEVEPSRDPGAKSLFTRIILLLIKKMQEFV